MEIFFFGWDYVSTMYLLSSTVLTHLNRISTQNFNKDLDQFLIVMFIVFLIIIIFFYEFSFLYCMKKLQNHFFWLNHFDRMISNASIYAWIIKVMCSSLILTRKPEKRYPTANPSPTFSTLTHHHNSSINDFTWAQIFSMILDPSHYLSHGTLNFESCGGGFLARPTPQNYYTYLLPPQNVYYTHLITSRSVDSTMKSCNLIWYVVVTLFDML